MGVGQMNRDHSIAPELRETIVLYNRHLDLP